MYKLFSLFTLVLTIFLFSEKSVQAGKTEDMITKFIMGLSQNDKDLLCRKGNLKKGKIGICRQANASLQKLPKIGKFFHAACWMQCSNYPGYKEAKSVNSANKKHKFNPSGQKYTSTDETYVGYLAKEIEKKDSSGSLTETKKAVCKKVASKENPEILKHGDAKPLVESCKTVSDPDVLDELDKIILSLGGDITGDFDREISKESRKGRGKKVDGNLIKELEKRRKNMRLDDDQ